MSIYRFRTNPEGKDRAASCRPPSVLVPGSALGACRHGALSSAQAVTHRNAVELRGQRLDGGLARLAGDLSLLPRRFQLAIPRVENRLLATGQFIGGRDVADPAVEPDFVVTPIFAE